MQPITFQAILNALAEKYAKETIRHIKTMFNKMYNEAIRNHLCKDNPIEGTSLPKNAKQKIKYMCGRAKQIQGSE